MPPRPLLAGLLLLAASTLARGAEVTVFAAASLTNALQDLAASYQAAHPDTVVRTSFAASATLARQIEAGAPADLYAAADTQWMDSLETRGLIARDSRRNLLGNTLVLVAPAAAARPVTLAPGKVPAFEGRLCMGEPATVPAGRYGRQALQRLGWWPALQGRIAGAEDVRAALAFVARGDCALGIVYATDAALAPQVKVVARFPAATHDAIVYPFALLPSASLAARDFYRYLQGPEGRRVFSRYGFAVRQP